MRTTRSQHTPPSPLAKPALAAWSRAGIASLVATSMLFSSSLVTPALAGSTEDGPELLTIELSTLGASTDIKNVSAVTLEAALTQAIAETTNDTDCPVESLISYILSQRSTAGTSANDATTIAPAVVTAAIKGLQNSLQTSSVLTTTRIQAILNAASTVVLPLAAQKAANTAQLTYPTATPGTTLYTQQATKYAAGITQVQTAVNTAFGALAAAAAKGIPVSGPDANTINTNVSAAASTVVAQVSNFPSFNITTTGTAGVSVPLSLTPDQIGAIAGSTIKAFSPAYQAAATSGAAASAVSTLRTINGGTLPDSTIESLTVALLKGAPPANAQQVADQTVSYLSDKVNGARYIFGALPTPGNVSAITKALVNSDPSLSDPSALGTYLQNYLAAVTPQGQASSANDLKISDAVRASIAAGAVAANPGAVNQVLSGVINALKPTSPKISAPLASSLQGVLTSVIGAIASTNPDTVNTALSTFLSNSSYVSTFQATYATNLAFAKAVLTAANTGGLTNTTAGSNIHNQQAISSAVSQLAGFAPSTGQLSYIGSLATSLATNYTGVSALVQTVASNWDYSSSASSLHDLAVQIAGGQLTGGSTATGTVAAPAAKAAVAAGLAAYALTGDTSGATSASIAADVAFQYNNEFAPAATNAQKAAIASSVINAVQSNTNAVSGVFNNISVQLLNSGSIVSGFDLGSYAAAIVKSTPAVAGTITTNAVTQAGGDENVINTIASSLIKAVPTNTVALAGIVSNSFPTNNVANAVSYINSTLKASPVAASSVANAIASQVKNSSSYSYSDLFTTPYSGASTLQSLGTNTAKLAGALAALDQANATTIAGAAINSAAGAGPILAAIATNIGIPSVGSLVGNTIQNMINGGGTLATVNSASLLGLVGKNVAGAVPGAAGDVVDNLVGKIKSIASPSTVVISGSAAAIAGYQARNSTQVGDLATFAGNTVANLTSSSAIDAVIQHTIAGTDVPLVAGQTVTLTLNVAKPPVSGQPTVQITTSPLWNKFLATAATFATNSAPLFTTEFLSNEQTNIGITNSDTTAAFIASTLGVSVAKAAEIAQGAANFVTASSFGSDTGFADQLISKSTYTNAALALLAKGFAKADTSNLDTYAYKFASQVPTSGKGVTTTTSNAAKVAVATAVGSVSPQLSWKVAKQVSLALDVNFSGTNYVGRQTLLKSLIPIVYTGLNKITNNEVVGLITAQVVSTVPSNAPMDEIAKLIAYAIDAKNTAAYDIFGSVASLLGKDSSYNSSLATDVLNQLISYVPSGSLKYGTNSSSLTLLGSAIKQKLAAAGAQAVADTTFFFSTGDLTGQETCVTNG